MINTIKEVILNALHEDIPSIDITSDNLLDDQETEIIIYAEDNGVLSGLDIVRMVFKEVDESIYIKVINNNSTYVETGDVIAIIKGKAKSIMKAEGVALRLLQRMSGIATITKQYVNNLANDTVKILDTMSSTPGLRLLDKIAVVHGGGINHRSNLSEQVLIRQQHLKHFNSISDAVDSLRFSIDRDTIVEVECQTFEQFVEALSTSCDMIMINRMSLSEIKRCVAMNKDKLIEVNGYFELSDIKELSNVGMNFISVENILTSFQLLKIKVKYN